MTASSQRRRVNVLVKTESPTISETSPSSTSLHTPLASPTDEDDHLADVASCAKYGVSMQVVRACLSILYLLISCLCIHAAQLLAAPLYFVDRATYYAFMAVTKQYFGILITTITQWGSPTLIRISGDASMAGQLIQTESGLFEARFPERLVLVANHQLYTDWLYLWWIAYTAHLHGHVYIILKESLKWIPLFGPGMQFFSFIFMARKWTTDQLRMRHRLQKLRVPKLSPLGATPAKSYLDPMWLLIFPEGTVLASNTRAVSAKWAAKENVPDTTHVLLPRTTGLQFCLDELSDSVEYLYDCTIAYEHIPPGQYGEDIFTLKSVYLEGRPPKSVNMHWRRWRIAEIPVHDRQAMQEWTVDRWREKDAMICDFLRTGRFPCDERAITRLADRDSHVKDEVGVGPVSNFTPRGVDAKDNTRGKHAGCIETQVRLKHPLEFLQIFVPALGVGLLLRIAFKLWNLVRTGNLAG